jgi:hypothetical protein
MQKPKIDEKWEVRIKFWPEDSARLMIVEIYYVWASGAIEFKPAFCYDGPPIADYQCAQVEWIRKVEGH